jgi:hypothetical protein
VLYHAEAEWSGEAMLFHKPVKVLLQQQIDCDVLPADAIIAGAVTLEAGKLKANEERFDCFIVPYSEALPAALLERLADWGEQGLPIWFIGGLPTRASEGGDADAILDRIAACAAIRTVGLHELSSVMRAEGFYEIKVADYQPQLRYYHIRHHDLDAYMFFNEHPHHAVATDVSLPERGKLALYDGYANRLYDAGAVGGADGYGAQFKLTLAPFETAVVLAGAGLQGLELETRQSAKPDGLPINGPWTVELATSEQYPAFTRWQELGELSDLSRQHLLPAFSGTFRYCTSFASPAASGADSLFIDLGEVYETAEVFVNGTSAGVLLSYPYRLDIGSLVTAGANELVIEVTNTLVKAQPDFMSRVAQQEPSGLLGPVMLYQALR